MAVKIKSKTVLIKAEEIHGDTVIININWKAGTPSVPVNFTGSTALMQFKDDPESPVILLSLTDADGITLGDGTTDFNIIIEVSAARSKLLPIGLTYANIKITDSLGKVNTWAMVQLILS